MDFETGFFKFLDFACQVIFFNAIERGNLWKKGLQKTACQVILVNVIWKVNIVKEIAAMASEKFDKEHQLTLLEWGEKNLAEG